LRGNTTTYELNEKEARLVEWYRAGLSSKACNRSIMVIDRNLGGITNIQEMELNPCKLWRKLVGS
jgi:hypothetical protein